MSEAALADAAAGGAFRHLTAGEAWNLLLELGPSPGQLLVLDVRDTPSFARAHLDGAVHYDVARLPDLLRDTNKSASVIVYCYHGHLSQQVAEAFATAGFANVFSVDGGFEALAREYSTRTGPDVDPEDTAASGPVERFIVGDCVHARTPIVNDGGVPDLASDAVLAVKGARGVVVQVGHAEQNPRQALYAVRFEDAEGNLGPLVGCLPEELLPASAATEPLAT